jgi:hypothetical protein
MPPKPTPQPIPTNEVTYENLVGPLLLEGCGTCHKAENGLQGLNLATYEGIMTGSVNGGVIIPTDPENSLLIQKITGADPHFAQLNDQELEWVTGWIKAGAPQEKSRNEIDKTKTRMWYLTTSVFFFYQSKFLRLFCLWLLCL